LPQFPVISIIDDDASARTGTENLVSSRGFAAYTFASAGDFLRSPHMHETSCVVADVQMPGMSGPELQDVLAVRGYRVPIIFITAFPDQAIRSRVLKAGAIGILTKPFEESVLMECINIALKPRV
jgi:FixJ family two-component response regulator